MKKLILFTIICFLCISSLSAQVTYVSGTVSSQDGERLPGVTVTIEGTTQGTITNLDGNYSIIIPGAEAVLVFTSVGYVAQAVRVGEQSVIDVVMVVDKKMLKDVVIEGYTSKSMRNVSGSVSKLDPIQMKMIPTNNIADQLQGMAPGVFVLNTARPGGASEVRIRGFTTLNNNRPLYVIDGNPTLDGYRFLNPNDVESLQILKDASAASIYGSRAANGVIIVTTKKAKMGDPQFSFDAYAGVQMVPDNFPEMMNPTELLEVERQARITYNLFDTTQTLLNHLIYSLSDGNWGLPDYLLPNHHVESLDGPVDISDYYYYDDAKRYTKANKRGTDWLHEIFAPAPIQNYNFSLSYGNEKGSLLVSMGYFDQKGILKYNDYSKYSFRINGNLNFVKRIRFGESVAFTFENGLAGFSSPNNPDQNGAIYRAYLMPEIFPVHDVAGNYAGVNSIGILYDSTPIAQDGVENPIGWLDRIARYNTEKWYNIMGSFFIEADLAEGLTFKTSFNPTLSAMPEYKKFSYYYPDDPIYHLSPITSSQSPDNGFLTQNSKNNFNWSWYNTLTYNKTFNEKHNLKILVGIESVTNKYRYTQQTAQGYSSSDPDFREIANGQKIIASTSNIEEWALLSFFAKADYDFQGKYLLSATLRRDGSSRFGPENRYGNFPAFSAAWRISGENFMQGLTFLNDFKIRGSWGQTGNQEIKTDRILTSFIYNKIMASYDIDGTNNSAVEGITPLLVGNPFIKWETTTTTDFGFDAAFFNNRLSAGFDWYNRKTEGILQEVPSSTLSGTSAYAYSYKNIDTMQNKGIDAYLQYRSSVSKDFSWSIGVNFSHYKNEVIYIYSPESTSRGIRMGWTGFANIPPSAVGDFMTISKKGSPMASFKGYQVEGVFQDAQDINSHAYQGDIVGYWGNTEKVIGTWKYKDNDKNDTINYLDQPILGSPHPKFVLGVPVTMNYKKFDLSLFFYGSFGNKINNETPILNQKKVLETSYGMPGVDNSKAILPKPPLLPWKPTSYTIEDGSFLRLRQVTLGYTFNAEKWKNIKKFRIYAQALNLFTITKYTGMDPMVSINTENDLEMGADYSQYPATRSFLLGVNLSF